ncbi:MAG TPA: Uma2 family endonuclease [Longimicrobium sp.]
MSTQPAARPWTYEEFARLPDDGQRYEVIGGVLYVSPAPQPLHQEISARLFELLRPFARKNGLGRVLSAPIDVLFGDGDYMEPDLVFIRAGRRGVYTKRGLESAPDLVVEVISPTTGLRDRSIKRERYAHFGVPEYWIVDPSAERIEVYRPESEAPSVLITDILDWQPVPDGPKLTIDVVELFSDLDELLE